MKGSIVSDHIGTCIIFLCPGAILIEIEKCVLLNNWGATYGGPVSNVHVVLNLQLPVFISFWNTLYMYMTKIL